MNDAQRQSLKNLIHAVERIRREAEGKYLPFELSAAIESADQARNEVYEIAYSANTPEAKGPTFNEAVAMRTRARLDSE